MNGHKMEKLSTEKLLHHKIIRKVNDTQNLCHIEQPLQAPCLPSGGPQKLRNPFQVIFLNFWYSQGFSLNVCFNFACLFELKKCFFLFSLPSKMADAPLLKIPSNFYTASIFIGLRNTGRRLTAKHQMPFISLTFLKDKKREKKSCFVRKILLIIMTMTFFMTNVTSRGRKMLLIMISTRNLQSSTPLLSIINSWPFRNIIFATKFDIIC